MRKRINLSVSEDTYLELTKVQEEYGFKNVCEVAATLLSLFLKRVRKVEETDPLPEDDEQTIREMFEVNISHGWRYRRGYGAALCFPAKRCTRQPPARVKTAAAVW